MESKILEILERNSEWIRGTVVPFGIVEENRVAIAKDITLLICKACMDMFGFEDYSGTDVTMNELLANVGFTPAELKVSFEKLNVK